ncbi:MAG: hypothetical protein JWN34_5662 [Bryobacterales bacterium]|jgi:hypothetical protein|nr:hypothetical protein [Bryobacterales bacterium]
MLILSAVALPLALLFAPVSAEFAVPCASHIPESWTGEAREAALVDCAFTTESQTSGAQAWAKYAAEDAASGPLRGPAEIRAAQAKVYARPGYKLFWYPTEAKQMGSFVVTSGRWERHVPGPAGGAERVLHGRYVTLWQKQKAGGYKWVWDGGENDAE